MAGVRNLRQTEAIERGRLLDVELYDVSLDLANAGSADSQIFRSVTEVRFSCREPGATTFIEIAAHGIRSAVLNSVPVDLAEWSVERGLILRSLAEHNVLVVDADFLYSTTGQGLHRSIDPVDGEVYLYSQFETADAQRVFACFDQPDLKADVTWSATVPSHWRVISNMPQESEEAGAAQSTIVRFARSPRMSTYIMALCAGPYHEVRDHHDGIDLGLYCRQSMQQYLDADDILLVTRQGLDFFNDRFGIRYPLPKYDQVFSPDFNAGAMENFGCVVHAEQHYLYRSPVTDYEYEQRANTILHEMAHMWFGNLVTMRWWDDLWLNESFAEWASHWCSVQATRFTDAWTTFLSVRKGWGYRQDQLSSTHPVYCEMPDLESVEVNFDGITYAKGASILKQLVAYVGEQAFVAGLRDYFTANAWGNATFDDLLSALERSSGRKLREFASQWLETSQVNTLRPEIVLGEDGCYQSVAVLQGAPATHPTLRTHRIGIGLYDLDGDRLALREQLEMDIDGARTPVGALTGLRAADVLLLNDRDLAYAKLRLDPKSMATVVEHLAGLDNTLARGLCWAAAWDMVRDGELATRDYLRLVTGGLRTERDVNLVTTTLRQLQTALTFYADPAWAPEGWQRLARAAERSIREAEPGSGLQLTWVRAYTTSARGGAGLAVITDWLDGQDVPPGLRIESDLRWAMLQALVAGGIADAGAIESELEQDRTASGERQAAMARALIPTAAAKAATWQRLVSDDHLPNWLQRAMLQGFQHSAQVGLTAPYAGEYFTVVDGVWARRDSEQAQDFIQLAYPAYQVSQETVALTDAWLADSDHAPALRRLVIEGKDGVVRALRARAKDAA
ncbi:MAG: aminopeptidase N [Micromonosporaceae bacterium]|nr:aminopeptidase N [Micromonosporaceae bacterium]